MLVHEPVARRTHPQQVLGDVRATLRAAQAMMGLRATTGAHTERTDLAATSQRPWARSATISRAER